MKRIFHSVSGKLLLSAGLTISAVLIAFTIANTLNARDQTERNVLELAEAKAGLAAQKVVAQMAEATSAGKTVTATIEGYLAQGNARGRDIIAMLQNVAPHYPNMFGSWMEELLPPGSPRPILGQAGRNEQGVFAAYWTKDAEGEMGFSTWEIDPESEYYTAPLAADGPIVTSPYLSNGDQLIMSVALPVRMDGEIVGIAGVDLTIDDIEAMISELRPFEGGRVMLVTSTGAWASNPDRSLLMTPYADKGAELVQQALADGEMKIISDMPDGGLRLVYPFSAPGMNSNWAAVLDVPAAVISGPIMLQTLFTVIGGVLILAGTLLAVWLSSQFIVNNPIKKLSATMNTLASGSVDVTISGANRRDEIGAMAQSVQVFKENAVKVRDLSEAEAERLARTARERAEMMAELQGAFGRVVDAAVAGDFSNRVTTEFPDPELNALGQSVNQLVSTVDRGLGETGQVLAALADANLSHRVSGDYSGAFHELKENTNAVAEKLTEIIGRLRETSGSLRIATGEILAGANDLSERTTHQAAAIEETSATMEQLATTVVQNAAKAEAATEKAAHAAHMAEEGGAVMTQANGAMGQISRSSEKISNIIGMIDDIAFQTNLLALNASVEAARAGEAGKGFAVVAIEVRRLAQSAAEASSEVKELIEQSAKEVGNGTRLVADAATKLQAMLKAVEENSTLMREIATESRMQASSIDEVNVAVRQLDEATQHNAALVEETNAAIEQTEAQTSELDDVVSVFKLAAQGGSASRPRVVASAA
ncbi:methyl-accepting chemotaxis protein [Devosia sp.]|uniref:methyl-accepting chemotaxis protein n=1 Tax=Devosia sp. TaxID=1871048 RepID=UPI003A926F9B